MNQPEDGATPSRNAWQPFTFGGVAAFASARLSRALLAELVTAILVSASIVYSLQHGWSPAVAQLIQQMPETARIAGGQLAGIDESVIAETKYFAIAVTPESSSQIGQSADVQVQLRPADFRVGSVFLPDWGWEFNYGPATMINLSRSYLEPWWGAWQPVILALIGVTILVLMFLFWAILALVYMAPAKCIGWFADRQLTWGGAWRLSSAALLPGAFYMIFGVLLYSWRAVDLIGLAFIWLAHMLMGWVYVIGGSLACPRLFPQAPRPNPFTS